MSRTTHVATLRQPQDTIGVSRNIPSNKEHDLTTTFGLGKMSRPFVHRHRARQGYLGSSSLVVFAVWTSTRVDMRRVHTYQVWWELKPHIGSLSHIRIFTTMNMSDSASDSLWGSVQQHPTSRRWRVRAVLHQLLPRSQPRQRLCIRAFAV